MNDLPNIFSAPSNVTSTSAGELVTTYTAKLEGEEAKAPDAVGGAHAPASELKAGGLGTDLDAALRFVEWFGDSLRHVRGVGWLAWDGRRWCPNNEGRAQALAMQSARAWTQQCALYNGPDREKQLREAMTLEGAHHIRNAVSLAQNLAPVKSSHDLLDSNDWLLNCRNGTLDLRTGKLSPHSRDDLLTKLAPVDYRPDASHWALDQYLATLSAYAPEMPDFLARCFGAALTGDTTVESIFLIQGDGGSGKTTMTEAVARAMGDYAVKLAFESVCQSKHGRQGGAASPDLVPLRGARLAYATEGDTNSRLDAGRIKEMSGGEPLTVRPLYQPPITIAPTWKVWLVSNYDPKTDSEDTGIWRRMVKVHFTAIPEEKRDPRVKSALLQDPEARSAVLAWVVRGCLEWQKRGLGKVGLGIPASVKEETDAYRRKQDTLAVWWEDLQRRATLDPDGWTSSKELRRNYEEWTSEERAQSVSPRRLYEYLERKGLHQKRISGGERGWQGISLA